MYKQLVLLVFTLLVLVTSYIPMSSAVAQSSEPRLDQISSVPSQEDAFKQLVRDYLAAWSPGREKFDIQVPKRFYSQGSDLTAYDILPPVSAIVGWENYKIELTRIMNGFSDFNILPNDDLRVFQRGNIAWTTISFKTKGAFKTGQPINGVGRVSLIWEHQNGQWLIVHEHSSVPIAS